MYVWGLGSKENRGWAGLSGSQQDGRRCGFLEPSNTFAAGKKEHLEVWLFFPHSEDPDSGTSAQIDTKRRD